MAGASGGVNGIDAIIRKNRELLQTYKDIAAVQSQINKLMNTMNNGSGTASRVGGQSIRGVEQLIRKFTGSVGASANGASPMQRMKDLTNQANTMMRNLFGSVSNSSASSRGGAGAIGNVIGKIAGGVGKKAKQAIDGLFGPATLKSIGKVAGGIGLVATALGTMYKMGGQAYQQNIKLRNSLTQLGDGADYAYKYASKLNEELGTPLNKSIENISSLAAQLKTTGGWSGGATGLATQAYDLSTKVGLFYQNDPQEVFENMQRAILTGEESLAAYNVQVGDDVLAGWLAATKGVNMYATELSEGAKQAYRWMMIQEQLADVSSYTGDLTNTAFAKQLQMMNKLEEMGIKLKALFMPLFAWLVDQANVFVDTILQVVNQFRDMLGMEQIEWQTTNMAERNKEIVSAIDQQNAAYRKQGELLKKNAAQRLPFDEWISLESMQQLNDELEKTVSSESFDNLGSFTGTDGGGLSAGSQQIQDAIRGNKTAEIEALIKTTDRDGLMELWDNFNLMQKGMYGTDVAVRLFQEGEIGKGLEALLIGAVGSFTGIEAIKELATGDYLGAIEAGAQTALFLFGGWKGKVAAASGVLVEFGLQLFGVSEDTAEISSIVAMIGILIGGWKGALIAALGVLVPIAAKVGEIAGKWANMQLNGLFGADGLWGDLQSWDARTAANMRFGEGTPEAEAEYYRLMDEKFGEGSDYPKYASGGIALSPHVAEIGHGREGVIPLDSPVGQRFARDMADMIVESRGGGSFRDPLNDASRNAYNFNVPIQNFLGDESALRQFASLIRNMILDIERNEGGAFSGSY